MRPQAQEPCVGEVEAIESIESIFSRFFAQGGALRMLASLDEADLARVRAYAQRRFSQGEIAAAQRVYFVLATLDQWSFDDWFGLGLCYQRLGQHGEALPCFAKAGVIRADDPRAPYLAGMSYQGIGNDEYAVKAYDATLRLCAGQSQHSELERSARARRDALTTSPTRGNT
ncbi:CesD/SycD/LcrH family type III secretion system chaperone [Pandoraea nosoerga]|uniref:CesD/SycD/LcrH family type III secretion system chaperone n=1 Tax=Pandoraea nosoerga TaxID=2508296 RepID=A0A5E4UTU0_9BURK|nr:SycD/LcrH family type III secretion system chaperone [Pandoraea nosoerga]MBN4666560.1 CesD/SycD/LcrH family type III secretion system chaperone [Pandoraea nosoerga]MBN4674196.1 CesD/SycD/LcrH family type III secretion system chaperone [Pandoraea nosoerga]MBN4679870.1 CesD/SycD/LcrH family type III secretion system chaperone [Pandoraea nosoerga]MBN4744415.1 CesD/SycD/LcrH family type III secretion system chaperone [Pandoraea nosoerga]VVE03358.1 CesD/SycD/LcrH family type III secretion system